MNAKVLLVDDEEVIRDSVRMFFKSMGIDILTAESGEECLDYLEDGFRGLIFMDIMMPEMDGWETIRQIVRQDLYEGNIIVMLSALDAPRNNTEGINEYITDYLTKPFSPAEMIEILQHYMNFHQSR